jgi:hypothetical protein
MKLNFDLGQAGASQFQVHPDGRRVVFTHSTQLGGTAAGRQRSAAIFALENFRPPAPAKEKK